MFLIMSSVIVWFIGVSISIALVVLFHLYIWIFIHYVKVIDLL